MQTTINPWVKHEEIKTPKDTSNLSSPSIVTEMPGPGDGLFPVFHEI